MRFYFDIHYGGKVHADDEGEEFHSIEDARAYVLSTTKEFYRLDQGPNRKVILYARIEITDHQGTSFTVPMAGQYCGVHHELPRRQRNNSCDAAFLRQLNSLSNGSKSNVAGGSAKDSIIYLVGLIVIVMFILSALGLR